MFREGAGHVSPDGAIRVIESSDGMRWKSAARLTSTTADLRDPKITIMPGSRLMITGAAALHQPKQRDLGQPASRFTHQSLVWFSSDGREWGEPVEVADPNYWLWRVTWHEGTAYGVGYECGQVKNTRLYRSRDGRKFEPLVPRLHGDGYPNETSLVFLDDGRCLCLLRRDEGRATGLWGESKPPYTDWQWKDLGVRIGGPHMIRLPDGRFLAAVRLYDRAVRTALCWLDPAAGTLTEFLALPSAGDTSYAGLAWHDGLLWVSYYASHTRVARPADELDGRDGRPVARLWRVYADRTGPDGPGRLGRLRSHRAAHHVGVTAPLLVRESRVRPFVVRPRRGRYDRSFYIIHPCRVHRERPRGRNPMDVSVQLGRLSLRNPILLASGTCGYVQELSGMLDLSKLGGVIPKTVTRQPRAGNLPPRTVEVPAGLLNSIGLDNDGIEHFLTHHLPYLRTVPTTVIANIAAESSGEFAELAGMLDGQPGVAAIELNLSCPNVAGGVDFALDPALTARVLRGVRAATSLPILAKLTPNIGDIVPIARAAADAGADALSLVNTVMGMAIDWRARRPVLGGNTGGLSGPALKPIALRIVWQVAQAVRVPIVGIGGISTIDDVMEFLVAGASAVQIGTANFFDPTVGERIAGELRTALEECKATSVSEIVGTLRRND